MVGQFHLKSLQSFHVSTNSMKIKTLVHSHIFQHMWQVLRALTKMKSIFMQLLSKNKDTNIIKKWKIKKEMKNKFFTAITMHYNWCSNHVIPMEEDVEECEKEKKKRHEYYDEYYSHDVDDAQLSGYLQWLEEEKTPDENCNEEEVDEIDKLADKFIASCHEKFRLEKQESYRRYQEMLARSM